METHSDELIREHQTQMLTEWRLLYNTINLLSLRLDERYAGDAPAETVLEELKESYNNFRREWDQCQPKKK